MAVVPTASRQAHGYKRGKRKKRMAEGHPFMGVMRLLISAFFGFRAEVTSLYFFVDWSVVS